MKKELKFIVPIFVIILLFSLLPLIRAQDAATAGSTPASPSEPTAEQIAQMTPGEQIEQTVGFNPEKIPKTPQETRDYLQQEWTKIVEKMPVIGNIHKFFIAHPILFQIVFNHPYEFSLTFILLFLLWLFILFAMATLLSKSELLNGYAAHGIGAGTSIILAHIGVLKALSVFLSNLALARDMWWMRAIVWVLIVVIFVILFYIDYAIAETLKERKKEAKAEEAAKTAKQTREEFDEFKKGAEEALNLTKDIPRRIG